MLRDLVQELLVNHTTSDTPVHVQAVVDQSAAETDPYNAKFSPTSIEELIVALRKLFNEHPPADYAIVLQANRKLLQDQEDNEAAGKTPGEKDMRTNMSSNKAEALIRAKVRQILREALSEAGGTPSRKSKKRTAAEKAKDADYKTHLGADTRAKGLEAGTGSVYNELPGAVKADVDSVRKSMGSMTDEDIAALKNVAGSKKVRGSKGNDEQAQQIMKALGFNAGMSQFMNLDKATKMRFFMILYITVHDATFLEDCVEDYMEMLRDAWNEANEADADGDAKALKKLNDEMEEDLEFLKSKIEVNPGSSKEFSNYVQKEISETIESFSPEAWKGIVDLARNGFEGVPGGIAPENPEHLRAWLGRREAWLKPGNILDRDVPMPEETPEEIEVPEEELVAEPVFGAEGEKAFEEEPVVDVDEDPLMDDDEFKDFKGGLEFDMATNARDAKLAAQREKLMATRAARKGNV